MNELLNNIPEPPRIPTERGNELIFKYQGRQKIMLIIGIAFLITGITTSGIFRIDLTMDIIIDISKKITTGTITYKDIDYSSSKDDDNPHEITFSYYIDEHTYTGFSITYNYSLLSDFLVGDSVTIEYSSLIPSLARIKAIRIFMFSLWRFFILIFPIIGLILTITAVRSNNKEKKAYKYGIPAIAKIISKGYDYSTSSNGKHPYQIIWKFNESEKFYTGSLSHMDPKPLLGLITSKSSPIRCP